MGRADGDEGADRTDFASYVDARADALLRYAAVLVPEPGLAADLARRVLLDVSDAWDDVVSAGLEDEVRDRLARAALRPRGHGGPRPDPDPPAAGLDDPGLRAATPSPSRELVARLDGLPPSHRVVLVRRHVDGLADDEIAARLGLEPAEVVRHGRGQVPERLVVPGLRAHEGEVQVPPDPAAWVRGARSRRGRRRLAVAASVLAALVVAGGLVARQAGQLSLSDPVLATAAVAADDPLLLPWPAVGALVGDTAWLRRAVSAWERTSLPDSGLTGPVHPLLAETFHGIPVAVLQGRDRAGHADVAVVAGNDPALVTLQQLPSRPRTVVALRVPVVFATGGSAIVGDADTDALLLGPQVLAAARSGARAGPSPSPQVGWQQVEVALAATGYVGAAGAARAPWVPVVAPASGGALVPLSPYAAGMVELDAKVSGDVRATTWRIPGEENPDLLLEPAPVQVRGTATVPFLPRQYDVAVRLWREVGGSGPVSATWLSHARARDEVVLDLVQLQPADPGGETGLPGSAVVVQQGTRHGREVCLSHRPLARLDVRAYPFVVAACTYPLHDGRGRATVVQGYATPQTPRSFPVSLSLRSTGPGGPSTTVRAVTIGDLGLVQWASPQSRRPLVLSATAVDSWNNLPPFVWRWQVGS